MITLNKVSKVIASEAGNFNALKENDVHIRKGEIIAISGPNSGKSTLLQLLGGLNAARKWVRKRRVPVARA
ncbi:MAG: transporter ATP-binding protein [Paenibacillaceae bacterium]|nr:transporter ATP-binding protein [Paenibacillaceae bacterium]